MKSFGINSSGSLTLAGEITLPNNHDTLLGLALDHSGTDLYASSEIIQSGGTVSSFSVDRGTGALSVLSPDPGTNFLPGRLLVHPNGQFVYATIVTPRHRGPQGGLLSKMGMGTGARTVSDVLKQVKSADLRLLSKRWPFVFIACVCVCFVNV